MSEGLTVYHSSDEEDLRPRRFLHVGTLDQARMRAGRHLHELVIRTGPRVPRLRDHGAWNLRALMRHAARARVAVYLNRHEGIPLHEFDEARRRADIDIIPDSRFRTLLPSAADSWIVLDPAAVISIRRVNRA